MIHFKDLNTEEFLSSYWQKKPLVIRKAFTDFQNPLSPEELAGLAMEEEIESRIVTETQQAPYWHLKRGPFLLNDFKELPETRWTLLVQGVDRFIPEVHLLLDHFNFLPQWRIDDVMISYATRGGNVGPHFDHYDVFLYQALGSRRWSLTSKNCQPENCLAGVELRIMQDFEIEEEYLLEEGDMLYLPPHIGHHGVAVSSDCMTYSFGYRSYQGREMLEDFTDFLAEHENIALFKDPEWNQLKAPSQIPLEAWQKAREFLKELFEDDNRMKNWFARFVTRLDRHAEDLLPSPSVKKVKEEQFLKRLLQSKGLSRNPLCRYAYEEDEKGLNLFINAEQWHTEGVSEELIRCVANHRLLNLESLANFLEKTQDRAFLFKLWKLQWLEIQD